MKTIKEVRARRDEVRPMADRLSAQIDAACAMEDGPARDAAFNRLHVEDRQEADPEIELQALDEVLTDLEAVDEVVLGLTDAQRTKLQEKIDTMCREIVNGHIRNARAWIEMFGTDSAVRIDVFSWVADVEPNYEPLLDVANEEKEVFRHQVNAMVMRIKKLMEEK